MSDGWHYQTLSILINEWGVVDVSLFLQFLKRSLRSDPSEEGWFVMFLTSSNMHIVFYLSRGPLQAFLLASPCLFCWMLWDTDVSLKYWIHPSLGCELSLLLKAEQRGGERKGEVGSLNKLPSVYLIYGAIRSVQCRLKLNFSSCEAS